MVFISIFSAIVNSVGLTPEGGEHDVTDKKVKEMASNLGADTCGIASVEGFVKAPKGFHPRDIFPETKSSFLFGIIYMLQGHNLYIWIFCKLFLNSLNKKIIRTGNSLCKIRVN